MKKLFLITTFVFLFNVVGFAGWADSMRQPCDPATSKPNTCFYTPDEPRNNPDNSTLTYIKTIIAEFNPFVYFLS